ncbi:MAG: serine/threonine protein kinase [Planctomycetes bacterium]|jgi:serine/threonine protein kinase|nr:serine/threonine protein kinase [Planctomycetota bacterium]
MPQPDPQLPPDDRTVLRARLAADLDAGKTISLSSADLAAPQVRQELPQLLEELTRGRRLRAAIEIPGYTLLGEIGHGGMSTVHLARQQTLGRHVALKIAPKWLGGDERTQQRLLHEARALARVQHSHIVAIHDVVESGDTVAIAMEWIDGLTLAGILHTLPDRARDDDLAIVAAALGTPPAVQAAFERTPVRFFARMLHDIARAVQRVHDAGLLHLDIKPSNVLVRRDGHALLADFGVVRERDLAATHTRTFAGTPIYSSPEQLRRQDARFGPHSDVYALGMTLYEALARRQPLQSLDLTRILIDVETGRVPSLAAMDGVPADLACVVHKAIAPEVHHRYHTAAAFADDLLAFLEDRQVEARPLGRLQKLERWVRTQPWKAALTLALLLLVPTLVVTGSYLWSQMPRLEAAARAERQTRANELRQIAYFEYFVQGMANGTASRSLREALELDQTPASRISLLAMAHEEQDPSIATELQAAGPDACLGLRLFAQKVASGRSFFDAAEVAQLIDSTAPEDKYVLALDRALLAEDNPSDRCRQEAAARLEEASIANDADPLLQSLRLWQAATRRDATELHAIRRAMTARWPDSPACAAWIAACSEFVAPAEVDRELKQRLADEPHAIWAWEHRAGQALRGAAPDPAAALAIIAAAREQGIDSPQLRAFEALATARADAATARLWLQRMPPDRMTPARRLRLLTLDAPGTAAAECARWLEQPRPRWSELEAAHGFAMQQEDSALADRVWDRAHELYPDRRSMHSARLELLYRRRELAKAAELAREYELPDAEMRNAPIIAQLLAQSRSWRELFDFSLHWQERGPAEQRAWAASHAGLAAARVGELEAAIDQLAIALAGRPPLGKWYAHALLEDAWLRVAPDAPAPHRDPLLARARIEALARHNPKLQQKLEGPWTDLVRAEVEFANGNLGAAKQLLARAAAQRVAEVHAPDDLQQRIAAARVRYGT